MLVVLFAATGLGCAATVSPTGCAHVAKEFSQAWTSKTLLRGYVIGDDVLGYKAGRAVQSQVGCCMITVVSKGNGRVLVPA